MSRPAGAGGAPVLLVGGLLGLAAGGLGYALVRGLVFLPAAGRAVARMERGAEDLVSNERVDWGVTDPAADERRNGGHSPGSRLEQKRAARKLQLAAGALAFSVLADSGLEHYRGGFYNRLMYLAPAVSATVLAASAGGIAGIGSRRPSTGAYAASVLTGLVGSGFHVRNVAKREGGWRWLNLFYGAPLAAPMGLVFAGMFGLAAQSLDSDKEGWNRGLEASSSRWLALLAAAGLAGTSGEAALLHFRGAFHDPYMFLPVIVPPLAATAVAAETLAPRAGTRAVAMALLRLNWAVGSAGMAFHAYGVQRNMGGWRNWSQNLLQGPPLPAPPSFTGMALAAEAALDLQR
ncbi:MAG: hypothetical protein WD314_06450, partial [Trueperaceae bacterium]